MPAIVFAVLPVGSTAKTMMSLGKQFTATCEMLNTVAHDQSAELKGPDVVARISVNFSKLAFVLFCHITNHLVTGPLGNSEFCFPRISMLPKTKLREIVRFESPGDVRTGEKRKAQVTKRSHKRRGENRK